MSTLVESDSPATRMPGTTEIKFEVYRDGTRVTDFKPVAVVAMGSESVPMAGEVAWRDGLLVLERRDGRTGAGARKEYPLAAIVDGGEGGEQRYGIDLAPELCGHLEYRLRAYPYHPALMHRFEMGLMRWV